MSSISFADLLASAARNAAQGTEEKPSPVAGLTPQEVVEILHGEIETWHRDKAQTFVVGDIVALSERASHVMKYPTEQSPGIVLDVIPPHEAGVADTAPFEGEPLCILVGALSNPGLFCTYLMPRVALRLHPTLGRQE